MLLVNASQPLLCLIFIYGPKVGTVEHCPIQSTFNSISLNKANEKLTTLNCSDPPLFSYMLIT